MVRADDATITAQGNLLILTLPVVNPKCIFTSELITDLVEELLYRHQLIRKNYGSSFLNYPICHVKINTNFEFYSYFTEGGDSVPKVAYSRDDREHIRTELVRVGLELMAKQGIQHTTVEQIYKKVGISRTFFYSFFATKEDLVVETLYLQQPKIIEYVQRLMADPALNWRDAVKQFLCACCYGEKNGIAVLTVEEQQLLFKRLSKESYQVFRQKQFRLFGEILENFGIKADTARINLFTNLSLTAMVVRRAIPDTLPLFVPEAADETVDFQINAIVDALEKLKKAPAL